MSILAIILIWNLLSLGIAYSETHQLRVDGLVIDPYDMGKDGPYFRNPEIEWLMNQIDNDPHMILVGYFGSVELIPYDNTQYREFTFEKIGDNVRILETGETLAVGSSTVICRYDLLTNFFSPWLVYKREFYAKNEGAFENLISGETYPVGENVYENVRARWENLDFVILTARYLFSSTGGAEFSPYGPIQLIIVAGVFIYVWKRWH